MEDLIFHTLEKDNIDDYITGCDFVNGIYLIGDLERMSGCYLVQADTITMDELEKLDNGIYDATVCFQNREADPFKDSICIESKLFLQRYNFHGNKNLKGILCSTKDNKTILDLVFKGYMNK